MIERKQKICKGCGLPRFIWARGFCKQCDPGKPKSQAVKDAALQEEKELNDFYALMSKSIPKHCDECGDRLFAVTTKLQRCVTAHILPKATFDSIKVNPINVFYLGVVCGCHDKWDRGNAESRKKMRVYNNAVLSIRELVSDLTDKEIVQAEKYLGVNL